MSKCSDGKGDPVKLHKIGTSLYDSGKYKEAIDKFIEASRLYEKVRNYFDASYTLFKAGECDFFLKNYNEAIELFTKAADIALEKGYDRFGLGALEYSLDCYKALGKEKDNTFAELKEKIERVKKKVQTSAF